MAAKKATNRTERVFSLWLPAEKPQQEPPFTLCSCVCVCMCMCAEHCYKLKQSQIHIHQHTHTLNHTCVSAMAFHPVSHVKCSSCISVIFNVFPFTFICAFSTLIFLAVLLPIACNGALQFVVVAIVVAIAVALRHCCCCFVVIYDSNWVSSKFFCLVFTSSLSEGWSKLGAKILAQVECIFCCILLGGR